MSSTASDTNPSGSYEDFSGSGPRSATSDSGSSDSDAQMSQSESSVAESAATPDGATKSQTASGQSQDQIFSAVIDLMKGSPMWQQFGLLTSQLGMSADLLEQYLCLVVKGLVDNADVRAQISAQTGGQSESNPRLMVQMMAAASMQQAMNPMLMAQFLAQNAPQQAVQPPVGPPTAQVTEQSTWKHAECSDSSDDSSSTAALIKKCRKPVPRWRLWSVARANRKRLEEICMYDISYSRCSYIEALGRACDFIIKWERKEKNAEYVNKAGEFNVSDEELINIGCWPPEFPQKLEYPNLEELRAKWKPANYTPRVLGVFPRSFRSFARAQCHHHKRIVLPPSTEKNPIVASIRMAGLPFGEKELFIDGNDTVMKAKKKHESIFLTGAGYDCIGFAGPVPFMYVSGVRFLDCVFPPVILWRRRGLISPREWFGRVQFMNCTFDKVLVLHSDAWLYDCKGVSLLVLACCAAHCIRCEFKSVVIFRGYVFAKECHFGEFCLGHDSREGEIDLFDKKTDVSGPAHYFLDKCVVDKAIMMKDPVGGPPDETLGHFPSNWSDHFDVMKQCGQLLLSYGWPGASCSERYILRTVKICSICVGKRENRCLKCNGPVRQQDKTISICQFCAPESPLGLCLVNKCALCGETVPDARLLTHARICWKCAADVDSCACMECGMAHGDPVLCES